MLVLRKELDPDAPDAVVVPAPAHLHFPDNIGLCPDCYEAQYEADLQPDREVEDEY